MPVQTFPDLDPTARRVADLLMSVPDAALTDPTPCPEYTLGDLIDHIGGCALAFADAARKVGGEAASPGDASRLEEGWRTRIASDLRAMADAWNDPQAWSGMTKVGGVEMPAEMIGRVGLDELVVHGWDVAQALHQTLRVRHGVAGGVPGLPRADGRAGDGRAARDGVRARGRGGRRQHAAGPRDRAFREAARPVRHSLHEH